MRVRVLGCSGAIARGCRTTAFLIDSDLLVDAGTGVGDLSLEEMRAIDHVLLTHSHLDHVLALPLMADAIGSQRSSPLSVYALAGTVASLKEHIFNDVIWPDFTRIPTPQAPLVEFHEIVVGQTLSIGGKSIEVLPAVHTVPAAGYAVCTDSACWVFTGDTEHNPALWARLNQMPVDMLVIETAFSNGERDLARRSRHFSPQTLACELDQIAPGRNYPIYITHTKPAETQVIMAEVQAFDSTLSASGGVHDIRWLSAGQTFDL